MGGEQMKKALALLVCVLFVLSTNSFALWGIGEKKPESKTKIVKKAEKKEKKAVKMEKKAVKMEKKAVKKGKK